MTEDTLVAARDPQGFRPLCLGKLEDGYAVSSETCALDLIDAQYLRSGGARRGHLHRPRRACKSVQALPKVQPHAHCIFEFIYFARPDSTHLRPDRLPGAQAPGRP